MSIYNYSEIDEPNLILFHSSSSSLINNDMIIDNSNVMKNFDKLVTIYSSELYYPIEKKEEKDFTEKDIDFLGNVIIIKKKISNLNNNYIICIEEEKLIKKKIEKIESLKKSYMEIVNSFDLIINTDNSCIGDDIIKDEKLIKINDKLKNLIIQKELNEEKIRKLLEEMNLLKKIICIKDFTNEDNSKNILCIICENKNIEYCIDPCGHCFCIDCCERLNNKCHMCRGQVYSQIKLYFN
jgi:hypothetical protein